MISGETWMTCYAPSYLTDRRENSVSQVESGDSIYLLFHYAVAVFQKQTT